MTLIELEESIKKNCVMDKNKPHFLATDFHIEQCYDLGFIIFIGIARLSGFSQNEVIKYLGISKQKYDILIVRYIQAFNEYKQSETYDIFSDVTPNKRIIAKMKLVSNALGIGIPHDNYITLEDFGF